MTDYKQFKKDNFSNEPFNIKVEKPWGYEIIFTPPHLPYTGKIIHVDEGKRLSLQVHDKKVESWILKSGKAKVMWDNDAGELIETELLPDQGFTSMVGQRHRLIGLTDCDIFEVSTPEIGTTFRLEDDYKRPDETEEMRSNERKSL
ncbi:MAG: mannose-6-phosphate isomerase [Patescibacteria group bacterium]|nr:mannose-6-phosphate isomerase [Patescibacteria group bacterium]